MISMYKAITGKVDNMNDQTDISTKIYKVLGEHVRNKNTVTEVKNIFNGLISRPNIAKERISKFEYKSIEIVQM